MSPKNELIRPPPVQKAFYKMAEWIVRKYKTHISGGGADPAMMGNTVAGRKFVDLLLLFIDQLGVISGLWSLPARWRSTSTWAIHRWPSWWISATA